MLMFPLIALSSPDLALLTFNIVNILFTYIFHTWTTGNFLCLQYSLKKLTVHSSWKPIIYLSDSGPDSGEWEPEASAATGGRTGTGEGWVDQAAGDGEGGPV